MKVWNIYKPAIHEHLWLWLTPERKSFLIGRMDMYDERRRYRVITLESQGVQASNGAAVAFDCLDSYSGHLGVTVVTRRRGRL